MSILDKIKGTPIEGPPEPTEGCSGYYIVDKEEDIPSLEERSTHKCPVCMYGKPVGSILRARLTDQFPHQYLVAYHFG